MFVFDNIKINNFYKKLKQGKRVDLNYFSNIDDSLKLKIIKDERFATDINVDLILTRDNDSFYINELFIKELDSEQLKILINRLISYYKVENINLTNLFHIFKNMYLSSDDEELKDIISKLLFYTVKDSYCCKCDYINSFIKLFNSEEKQKLLESIDMIAFITFHSKGTNPYFGYKNFFENILIGISNYEIKYEMMFKIFKIMPKQSDIKRLYLDCLINNLSMEYIVKLLEDSEFIENFKYSKDNSSFDYERLLTIINLVDDINVKKNLINNLFVDFEFIGNVIKSRNETKNNIITGKTIKAFYELGFINENIDELIIKSCKDEVLFETIEKYDNKQEKLLEISKDVDINLVLYFANKYNIDIYNEEFAKKFAINEEYFKNLPLNKSSLIQFYSGEDNDIFFEKLSNCVYKGSIICETFFRMDIKRLISFASENNINLYSDRMLERFSKNDKFYESLPKDKADLIGKYEGSNKELFFNKLYNCNNKLRVLFFNKLYIRDDSLLKESLDKDYFNDFDKKIIEEVMKIKDGNLRKVFKEYILENYHSIPVDKIFIVSDVLNRISYSNSIEILNFRTEIANQVINTDNPLDNLKRIEEIFEKNNLPTVGKIYSVFSILHPNFSGFNFGENSKISPVLKSKTEREKNIIIFRDLLKAALGSNNRSLIEYINILERGNDLYKLIITKKIAFNELDNDNKKILESFLNHVITLYNNTLQGKKELIDMPNNIEEKLNLISRLYSEHNDLSNKIVRMFCHFAGFDTIDELNEFINKKLEDKDIRNNKLNLEKNILEPGDLIKGIDNINYLKNILQNGSISKEYLGAYSSSDSTPLDTDLSMIIECNDTLEETINNTSSKNYGNFWLVLKNDDRFVTTRTNINEENSTLSNDKYELFYTGVTGEDHYGIRTGFASSDIDFIISKDNDARIGLEIAMNGFYIPVMNLEGKIIFSKEDYENLRKKMSGCTYYNIKEYEFSENLNNFNVDEILNSIRDNRDKLTEDKVKIFENVKEVMNAFGLSLKGYADDDLTEGVVELIDTGSTGRETNIPEDGDYDFMMRLDNSILLNPEKLHNLKTVLINSFESIEEKTITSNGDFRFKGVKLKGLDKTIDLDITFTQKTNKISYSTDSAIKDKLNFIKNFDSTKYDLVLANIILAKKVLKSNEVYKPNRGEKPEGGLGGVGVENWILQNGGSFIEAAKSFLECSNNKTFDEFKRSYEIWDFGENYLSNNKYIHDNFVANNMSEEGYNKMRETLKNHLATMLVNDDLSMETQISNKKL